MSNHLTVDANEHMMPETSHPKPALIRLAHYISIILSPAAVSLPMVFVVAFYRASDIMVASLYACIALFFISVGPLIYILIGVRRGELSDVDVTRRSERGGPYLFSISSVAIGLVVLSFLGGPRNLETVMLVTTVTAVILMVTNWWWKISVHASSVAGAATMLTALYGAIMLPSFLLLVLVDWSRVVLRRHTVGQVVAGSLVSIGLSTLILLWRGL